MNPFHRGGEKTFALDYTWSHLILETRWTKNHKTAANCFLNKKKKKKTFYMVLFCLLDSHGDAPPITTPINCHKTPRTSGWYIAPVHVLLRVCEMQQHQSLLWVPGSQRCAYKKENAKKESKSHRSCYFFTLKQTAALKWQCARMWQPVSWCQPNKQTAASNP